MATCCFRDGRVRQRRWSMPCVIRSENRQTKRRKEGRTLKDKTLCSCQEHPPVLPHTNKQSSPELAVFLPSEIWREKICGST